MQSFLQAVEQDDIKFQLAITMTLGEWKNLQDQMSTACYPANDISAIISDMVFQARKTYYPEETSEATE